MRTPWYLILELSRLDAAERKRMRTEFLQPSQPDLCSLATVYPCPARLPRRLQSWGRNSLVLPCTHAKNSQEPFRAGKGHVLGDLEPNHEHEQLKVQSRKGLVQDPMMEESSQSTNPPEVGSGQVLGTLG